MDREEKKKGKTSEELVAKDTEATAVVCEEVVAEDHDTTEKRKKTKKGKIRTTKKVTEKVTIQNNLNMLQEQLKPFRVHNHTNIMQLHRFKSKKDELEEGEIIISEDFSENYALKQQNKIMTAHWSNESLTLFCATVHYKRESKKTFQHWVLCSDDLSHEKNSIYYYNDHIINDLKTKGIPCTSALMHFIGQGPSCQFKNQYLFTNILFHEKDHGSPAWNYFTTSHGKGEKCEELCMA